MQKFQCKRCRERVQHFTLYLSLTGYWTAWLISLILLYQIAYKPNMRIRLLAIALPLFFFSFHITRGQTIARLILPAVDNSISIPVSICLDEISTVSDSALALREIKGNTYLPVNYQIENGDRRLLWWIINPNNKPGKRVYELYKKDHQAALKSQTLSMTDNNGELTILDKGRQVIRYNYGMHYPPAGVDSIFKRSGFLHPLWSPSGNVLTRVNPPDHHHHVGIWNPWTHVRFMGKQVDFWNIGDRKGTVRFSSFISRYEGGAFAGFKALQEHVAFNIPTEGKETVAMNEIWNVRVYNTSDNIWLIDFTSSLNCATDSAAILEEYRYGGFGFRASQEWNNQNSKVLTSEGKTRKDADASTARWCMIDGDMQKGHSGILFMDYPTNYNFPEPMRVWPENANKRGDVFFSFSPTRNKDWPLLPGKNYVLKYRMLVYDGTITKDQAEKAWKNFGHPPKIIVERL